MTVESFEAGSPALYEWYKECFDVFLNNSYLMDDYYKIETQKGLYKPSYELASRILNTSPFATKEFVNHEYVITSGDYFKQMFLNTEKASLYATSDEKEYPGEDFLILWEEK